MRVWKLAGVLIALVVLAGGALNAYVTSQRLNESTCLGCLALNPRGAPFTDFWSAYPDSYGSREGKEVQHPSWVTGEVNNGSVAMLFFWYHGCQPCKQQWDDMKKRGLVEGSEEDGRMAPPYKQNVTLIPIDVVNSDRTDARTVYAQPGREEFTPITVVVTGNQSGLSWYAFQGPADGEGGRPSVQELIDIIEMAIQVRGG
ncbi:MAG: hypothetical protein ACP5EK_02255 [Thermoplasmatota archaeon]